MAERKPFIFRDNTGGTNLRSNEANINGGMERTEATLIKNLEIYKEGGFSAQKGNTQLNTSVTDDTKVLGIGQFKLNDSVTAVYVKASGKAYAMNALTGGAETEIKSGLDTSAVPMFVEFNSKVICFNGVDTPWAYDGSVTPAPDLSGTPAGWSSAKPTAAAVYRGGRIFAVAGDTIYWCALGNENDWTTGSDAGSITGLFNDNSTITAIADYDTAVAIFSNNPKIYLLTGNSPSNYATDTVATNRAAKGKLGLAKSNDNLFFFAGDSILPLITTELGIIKIGKETDITYKISPFINDEGSDLPLLSADPDQLNETILLSNVRKNELIAYFKTQGSTYYDMAAILNFNLGAWVFRQATPVSAAAIVGSKVLTGTNDGKILEEFSGAAIEGAATYSKEFIGPWHDFGQPFLKKRITRFWLILKSVGQVTLNINFSIDYNSDVVYQREKVIEGNSDSAYGTGTYDDATYAATRVEFDTGFPINMEFRTLRMQLTTNDDALDFRVLEYAFEVEYGNAY
jgi:hypothetical protein